MISLLVASMKRSIGKLCEIWNGSKRIGRISGPYHFTRKGDPGMKLATTEQRKPTRVSLFNMAYGQVGIDDDGEVYYRTINTVACLTNYKMTYSNILSCDKDSPICTHEVTLYPPGTKLTFVVDI